MIENPTRLPTTTVRNDLLRDCLAWLGAHYDGGDAAAAWRHALRETLGLPPAGPVTPEQFTRREYDVVLQGFGEILALGLYFYNDLDAVGEAKVAVDAWLLFVETLQQPGRRFDALHYAHVEAMVAGLEHWVAYIPGGLQDATLELRQLMAEGE